MHLGPMTDTPNERRIEFSDGGHAKLKRTDPYGFWHIEWHNGRAPDALRDQTYTTAELARAAVIRFVNSNDYRGYAKVVDQKVEMAPPLEYKRRYKKDGQEIQA